MPTERPTIQPALLDLAGAAALCSLSAPAFRRLYRSRSVPAPIWLGRRLRWQTSALLAWIDGGCRAVDAHAAASFRKAHVAELQALSASHGQGQTGKSKGKVKP
jgi:predicted DNA-binding transcriptional regulator AlpA